MRLGLLELHVAGRVGSLRPAWSDIAIAVVATRARDALLDRTWRDDAFDFWAFDRRLDELAARGAPLRVSSEADRAVAITAEILTRAQRLAPRRNEASRTPWFDALLALHTQLHDTALPLVRADLDHAHDTWQWVLRLSPDAGAAVQLAALLHDVERLATEADVRVEHLATDYQAFKDGHASTGAAMASALLARAGVPEDVGRAAARLVAAHERASTVHDGQLLADADALSFFALNSPGYFAYFGPGQTALKVAYTLRRMSSRARRELAGVRLLAPIRRLLER